MYQCTVTPTKANTKYLCDADGINAYRRCHPDVTGRNFQMTIRTLGSRYEAASLKYLYIQVIDAATDDILTDMKLDPYYVANGYPVKNYEIDPDTMQYEEDITGSGSYDSPDCDPIVSIHVTACDDFDYGYTSNSLQMQMK
eukprot:311232_1